MVQDCFAVLVSCQKLNASVVLIFGDLQDN
jgi:hypothetical protein